VLEIVAELKEARETRKQEREKQEKFRQMMEEMHRNFQQEIIENEQELLKSEEKLRKRKEDLRKSKEDLRKSERSWPKVIGRCSKRPSVCATPTMNLWQSLVPILDEVIRSISGSHRKLSGWLKLSTAPNHDAITRQKTRDLICNQDLVEAQDGTVKTP
jgi:vacuolar-type H+-ATPase subunit I/STV1